MALSVRLSVSTITTEPLRDIIAKFSGHYLWVRRESKFENGYIGV